MRNLIAQVDIGTIEVPGIQINTSGNNAGILFGKILSGAIGILTIIAAIWFLFNIITGGISIIGAGGDKTKVAEARTKITNGVIGLIVVLTATMFVGLLSFLLGINDPLNIAARILEINPSP